MSLNAAVSPTFDDLILAGDNAVRNENLTLARNSYQAAQILDPESLEAKVALDYVAYLESGRSGRYEFAVKPLDPGLDRQKQENVLQIEQDFLAGKTRVDCLPGRGFIEHTTRCNFYCPHCSKGYDPYHAEDMADDLVGETLNMLLPRMTWACITGFGEPTIGSQYAPLMRRLVEHGVRPHFNTNTSTFTLPHIEQLVKSDAQITLSIDGASKETFETIRAGGSWEKLLYALHGLKRIRNIHGGKGWFDVTFVAMRANIHELPDVVRLTHDFGLDMVRVQDYHFHNIEYDEQSLRYEPERANHFIDEAKNLAGALGVQLLLPPPYEAGSPDHHDSLWRKVLKTRRLFPKKDRFPQRCMSPWQETNIHVDGDVSPCCFSASIMGNLKKKPFEKIWNGFRYRFFRWRIQSAVPPLECRWCHVLEGINKGNPSNVLLHEGLLLKIFYFFENRIKSRKHRRKEEREEKNYYKGKWLRG